jgi:hypothetical protein
MRHLTDYLEDIIIENIAIVRGNELLKLEGASNNAGMVEMSSFAMI